MESTTAFFFGNNIFIDMKKKSNLLFLMNNFNHENMDEHIDNRQETDNLSDVPNTTSRYVLKSLKLQAGKDFRSLYNLS
ncbi:hypothetical protein JHK87_039685 [Glycine soja]|nr:hypothetical protein JHK87_039685 [Glycine soja]